MTWTRRSDNHTNRIEIMGLSDAAYRAHDGATIWCNGQLTDGFLPDLAVPVALAYVRGDHRDAVNELEASGLWVRGKDGWQVDWTDQEESSVVAERQSRNAQRQAEYRERSSRHRAGDHSTCSREHCPALRNASRDTPRNGSRNASRNGAPTHPNPSHPIPSSTEDGDGQDGTHAAPSRGAGGAQDRTPRPDDYDRYGEYRPLNYLVDPENRHEGGWDGPNAWIQPSMWREGWAPPKRDSRAER